MRGGAPDRRQNRFDDDADPHRNDDGWGNDNPYHRNSVDPCPFLFFRGPSGGGFPSSGPSSSSSSSSGCCSSDSKKDCGQAVLIFFAVRLLSSAVPRAKSDKICSAQVVGVLVVIAAVFISVYKTIQEENKQARKYMVRQLRVVDLNTIDQ
jgi:hypothetical protein